MPGRYVFDMFHDVKREHKLDSYSLNFVSETFLGDRKLDMSPKEMFRRFEKGDPDELGEVADYCIKDTVLPHMLMDKLCNLLNLLEMAKATWVPISYLSERGQQIKVFSQMTRKAREIGFMVPTIRWGQVSSEKYEGATVLDAQAGAYYTPITALDFEGLYPSIMIAHNLCYSTLVMDERYANLPGVTYETFGAYKFAQDVPSLLPAILVELKQFRKKAKQDMAAATGDMKKVYNGKQLAYKISMNSVYGFTGAGKGMLPCVPIAATVTMKGRSMIEETKTYVEENFPGAKVRYGDTDSVMVEFDVQGRTGQDAIAYSWELGEKAAEACTSLFKKPNNLELEKVYYPYFLYSKKRYAAKLWTKNKKGEMQMDYIDVKGLQLVRRDNIPFVREVCKELLDVILESKNPEGAKQVAHSRAVELLDGRVPMEKLILSQKLADTYKSTNLPHVTVVKKMRERAPGSEPQSGDRVPFVLVKVENVKNPKQFEIAEDPKWVSLNKIPLNYEYYFTNKFMNPVCDLLEPLVSDPKEQIFGDLLAPKKKGRGKQTNLLDLFKSFEDKQKPLDINK
jgi:DNA polymerase delta subunit 1